MGYTHYWFRKKELAPNLFVRASLDCGNVAQALEIPLGNGIGCDNPLFDFERVCFNGVKECGHPAHDLGISWPDEEAAGVANFGEPADSGSWFAGAKLLKRACDGDCSHETFWIPRVMPDEEDEDEYQNDLRFQFCKTAFKPYDLAVQCCLIAFSHYFKEQFLVLSDGVRKLWNEPRETCVAILGYGQDFELSETPRKISPNHEGRP
jgi:hypothetical protein